ncbi:pentapeptide repeat-containing protein [Streptomyces sp. NPDC050804]|uniref:pentapeptide repeat-containing protein n=1 Tax=Streptomyces sp. NPDC050804 TaxID=3154745 RepID=UPI003412BEEF
MAFAVALLVAGGVLWTLKELLDVHRLKTEPDLSSETLFDLLKLSFGVVAGSGALVALVVAYRRQRVDEDGALREATRLHTERFTTAVGELGDSSAAVRLGGVHALSGLADDAPTDELRQTCIDVLCAYLRLPYTSDPGSDDQHARHEYLALREVRHTIIRLIRDHLRPPCTPDARHTIIQRIHNYRRGGKNPRSWQGHDFDFTNVVFDGGSWSQAQFSAGQVSFDDARFTGSDATFEGAQFSGSRVSFHDARFASDQVSFRDAQFTKGEVSFHDARFERGHVIFKDAQFSGGKVSFHDALFNGGQVRFYDARFTGSEVTFKGARFIDGEVSFRDAQFIEGEVSFHASQFTGSRVSFHEAQFTSGRVSFPSAQFSKGQVDLRCASGNAPQDLPTDRGAIPSGCLLLPERWFRQADGGSSGE